MDCPIDTTSDTNNDKSSEQTIVKMNNPSQESLTYKEVSDEKSPLLESTSVTEGSDDGLAMELVKGRTRRRQASSHKDFFILDENQSKPKKRKQENKQIDNEAEFDTFWVCCECKEAECAMKPEVEHLMICEGTCRRLFHYPCAGLAELPGDEESYVCKDCQNSKHACAICQEYGHDDEDVFNCSKDKCGLFFHEHCLIMQNVDVKVNEIDEAKLAIEQMQGETSQRTMVKRDFVCPSHWCWTCTQTELLAKEKEDAKKASENTTKSKTGKKKKKSTSVAFLTKTVDRVIRCMECPRSYHITCIPPNARFHELALLCHEHSLNHKLPELPDNSIVKSIEEKIEQKFSSQAEKKRLLATGKNVFFAGVSGDALTTNESRLMEGLSSLDEPGSDDDLVFCLPCDIKNEVHSKPPSYRHIHSLRYNPTNKPQKIQRSDETCSCISLCDDDCLNKVLYTECTGGAVQGGNGRKTNCNVGPNCGNRKLGQRRFSKCKIKREQGKGWGLTPTELVLKGELVQEYIGEVIDGSTKENRLKEWAEEHPNDPNFYIMSLKDQWYIDARHEGNLSRFINHSCEPNCILLQINVDGFIRTGIFALRDIEAGEFLSYDYHFDTKHGDKFICRCGSKKCRGTMQAGTKFGENGQKSKDELWEQAKSRFERDKKFLNDFIEHRAMPMNQTDSAVPAAENSDEVVAAGAQRKYQVEARRYRVFLWRNAVKGSDFASRLDYHGKASIQ